MLLPGAARSGGLTRSMKKGTSAMRRLSWSILAAGGRAKLKRSTLLGLVSLSPVPSDVKCSDLQQAGTWWAGQGRCCRAGATGAGVCRVLGQAGGCIPDQAIRPSAARGGC